jgi:acid phosphatase (class A)
MKSDQLGAKLGTGLALMCATVLSGCATTNPVGAAISVARTYVAPAQGSGYDWTVLLAKAPEPGSTADRLDMDVVRSYQSMKDSPRWLQARSDASLDMMQVYGPIIGPNFTTARRPEVVALLAFAGKRFIEAAVESNAAFPRPRPFLAEPTLSTCVDTPPAGSSYPSGHAGWGWLSAQILARAEPAFAEKLLARGRDYGLSRVVCAVHYPTDIEAGRVVADAVLVRLDNDPEYQRLMAVVKSGGE